jgi:hypothetical protein
MMFVKTIMALSFAIFALAAPQNNGGTCRFIWIHALAQA